MSTNSDIAYSAQNCELKYIEFLPCHYCNFNQGVNTYERNNENQTGEEDELQQQQQQTDSKCSQLINKDMPSGRIKIYSKTSYYTSTTKARRRIHRATFYMNKYELGYLVSQLEKSYRPSSSSPLPLCQEKENQQNLYVFKVVVSEPAQHYIDHKSNDIVTMFMVERRELEHSLNWLSTLGGAFSALGDNSDEFAHRAGRVSKGQLLIAMKLNDPRIMSRCRLYAAISLLQVGKLKSARKILEREWEYAKSFPPDSDPRLKRMCIGIWAKLQYIWKQNNHTSSQNK